MTVVVYALLVPALILTAILYGLVLIRDAYGARVELQRDLITQLTERKWSLKWDQHKAVWIIVDDVQNVWHGSDPRWEIAVQDALAAQPTGNDQKAVHGSAE